MDSGLLDTLKQFKLTSYKRRCTDKDFVDRLNDYYTPILLALFSIIISTKSYLVGNPLQCWIPMHFTGGWESFAESYCFVKNTYYFPQQIEIPTDGKARHAAEITYYQWVPLILGLQAALFLIPTFFWSSINWYAKLHLMPVIERAVLISHEMGEKRVESINNIAEHIHINLFCNKNLPNRSKLKRFIKNRNKTFFGLVNSTRFLTICYIVMKIMLLVNIVAQFFILSNFLHTSLGFGYKMARDFSNGSDWQDTGLFPRVSLCDFSLKQLGQPVFPYTLECVLVVNLFNEKVYMFIWFWFVMLALFTLINCLFWIYKILFRSHIKCLYSTKEVSKDRDLQKQIDYCEKDLTADAIFTLRLIRSNCGILTTRSIIKSLIGFYNQSNFSGDQLTMKSLPPDYDQAVQNKHGSIESSIVDDKDEDMKEFL